MNVLLWLIQGILALVFLLHGLLFLVMPARAKEQLRMIHSLEYFCISTIAPPMEKVSYLKLVYLPFVGKQTYEWG